MNGIINTGSITIGTPNITGSLILNIIGQIVIFPKLLYLTDLDTSKRSAKAKSIHQPTTAVHIADICCVIILGKGSPACIAATFSSVKAYQIGAITLATTDIPWIPADQKI